MGTIQKRSNERRRVDDEVITMNRRNFLITAIGAPLAAKLLPEPVLVKAGDTLAAKVQGIITAAREMNDDIIYGWTREGGAKFVAYRRPENMKLRGLG